VRIFMLKPVVGISLLLLTVSQAARGTSQTFYVESWKRGRQQIQEQKFEIKLEAKDPARRVLVKDSSGVERYELVITQYPLKEGGPYYSYWYVTFYDRLSRYRNVNLLTTEGPGVGDNFPLEDKIGDLYPVEKPNVYKDVNSGYPISAKRVIKVESFYIIIQVRAYKFNSANSRKLDSLTVEFELTNNPPVM
jgi:hypothetical protein